MTINYMTKIYKIICYVISVLLTLPMSLIICEWFERTYYNSNVISNVVLTQTWLSVLILLFVGLCLTISATIAGLIYNHFDHS